MTSRDVRLLHAWARRRSTEAPPRERPLWRQITADIDRFIASSGPPGPAPTDQPLFDHPHLQETR